MVNIKELKTREYHVNWLKEFRKYYKWNKTKRYMQNQKQRKARSDRQVKSARNKKKVLSFNFIKRWNNESSVWHTKQ